MSLEFHATLFDNDQTKERPQSTLWSHQKHAEQWARGILSSSADPNAYVVVTRIEHNTVAVISRNPETPKK